MNVYYVYILATERNGTLYVGMTSNLVRRMYEHKIHAVKGFTQKYNIGLLVYYEVHDDVTQAILREKQIKKWNRLWKLSMIEKKNPGWKDLYTEII